MTPRNTLQQLAIGGEIASVGRPLSVQKRHETASANAPSIDLRRVYLVVKRSLEFGETRANPWCKDRLAWGSFWRAV